MRKDNGKRHKAIILRSKVKWAEEGEKNTKFFLGLEKRNYNRKYIKKLITKNNEEVTTMQDILKEERLLYEDLYTSLSDKFDHRETYDHFLNTNKIPQLAEQDRNLCDEPLTIAECTKALKLLANNKSPGPDGFTTNFYKFFWIDIKEMIFESFKYSLENNTLSNDQKRGVLNLLPKENKDLRHLANWRPISLLQTDYKILTKALALRLQKVLPNIISPDQVGYIQGRYIAENIRTLDDLMIYANKFQMNGYFVLIDFRKAFDSIEWNLNFYIMIFHHV